MLLADLADEGLGYVDPAGEDHRADGAELLDRPVDAGLYRGAIGKIAGNGQRFARGVWQGRCDRRRLFTAGPIADGELIPFGRQASADRAAKPAGSADNEGSTFRHSGR